jgi:hypothetical protein
MKILKKHELGWDILWFRIGRYRFKWFTDCGEWFIYFIWNAKKYSRCVRLSGAGCYNKVYKNTKEE